MTLAPATTLAAGSAPTTTTVDSVSPVERTLQPYTVTATVKSTTGAPLTGVVRFRNAFGFDSRWQGQFGILGGAQCPGTSSTCTVSVKPNVLLPPPDVNRIYALYEGDDVHAASESEPVRVDVGWSTTTPTVTQSAATTTHGEPLTITASLALDAPSSYPDAATWFQRKPVTVTDLDTGQQWMSSTTSNHSTTEVRELAVGTHRLAVSWRDASVHPFPVKLPDPVIVEHPVTPAATGPVPGPAPSGPVDPVDASTGDRPGTGGDQGAPAAPPKVIDARIAPSGKVVARLRCAEGAARVKATRGGKTYARRTVRCQGQRQRLVLSPAESAARAGSVRVSVRFTQERGSTVRVRAHRDR
ncbi:MAG TPA: hypothetical protein VIL49_15415 [Capillimicrobium sp.]